MAEYTDESFTKDEWEKQQKKSTPAASVLPGANVSTAASGTEPQLAPANQSVADFAKESETQFNTTVADWAKKGAPLPSQAKPDTRTKTEKAADWASTPVGMTALVGGGLGLAALLAAAVSGNSKEGKPRLRDRSITNPPGGGGGSSSGPLPESGFSMSRGTGAPEEGAAFNTLFERATGQAPATAPAEPNRMARAATRIQEGQALGLGAQPAAPTAAPAAAPELPPSPRMVAVPNPNATSQWDQYLYVPETEVARSYPAPILNEGALSVAPPAATPAQTVAPSATPEPAIAGEAGAAVTPKRGRRTNAEKAAEAAAAPAGFKPQYKKPPEGMGPGAFNHLANNVGVEEATRIWEATYGKKNVPYSQFMQDYSSAAGKNMIGPVQPLPAGAKPGGSFGTPKYIPEYISGRAKPSGLLGLGAMAAALGLAGSEEGQKAMAKAASAIKDIGVSPDIFQGKGEELGRLGRGYVTAGNPAYLRELSAQLQTETDPQRRAVLLEEFQKAGGSGAGRGIAPPVR